MKLGTQRRTAWLLLIAFLHAVLAPTVAHAVGQTAHAVLLPVCTTEGVRFVPVDLDAGDSERSAPDARTHDGFCLLCFCPATPANAGYAVVVLEYSPARSVILRALPVPRPATPGKALARAPPAHA